MEEALIRDILNELDCPPNPPTLRFLNRIIHAYIRRVPWESVSRIGKRLATSASQDCPRLPEEFWGDVLQYGLGGTCYESSLAFYSLLMSLGYTGYLTVNDMGETRGCHAAIIILLGGHKYLVDISIPVHAAVRIDPHKTTRRRTLFHDYTMRPVRECAYEVMRSHHPNRNAFTLMDIPVTLTDYRAILERDYTETGLFLTSVVIVKVIGEKTWRFFSDRKPYRLESFNRDGKSETLLPAENVPHILAGLFQMPADNISTALSWVEKLERTKDTQQPTSTLPIEVNIHETANA